jgi:hypothetical protein
MHSYHIVAELRQIRGVFCPQKCVFQSRFDQKEWWKSLVFLLRRSARGGWSYPPLR